MKDYRLPPWRGALCLLACLFASATANAASAFTLEWQWPDADCDGGAIFLDEIQAAEVYVDDEPIPSQSEADGSGACGGTVDTPPASEIVQTVTTEVTTLVIDVPEGGTYFARMRVQVGGVWSNLSMQAEVEVPNARPGVPIIVRIAL